MNEVFIRFILALLYFFGFGAAHLLYGLTDRQNKSASDSFWQPIHTQEVETDSHSPY